MNVTHEPSRAAPCQVARAREPLVFALRKIARHVEIAQISCQHDRALALVDIEYEVRTALAAAGEPV